MSTSRGHYVYPRARSRSGTSQSRVPQAWGRVGSVVVTVGSEDVVEWRRVTLGVEWGRLTATKYLHDAVGQILFIVSVSDKLEHLRLAEKRHLCGLPVRLTRSMEPEALTDRPVWYYTVGRLQCRPLEPFVNLFIFVASIEIHTYFSVKDITIWLN